MDFLFHIRCFMCKETLRLNLYMFSKTDLRMQEEVLKINEEKVAIYNSIAIESFIYFSRNQNRFNIQEKMRVIEYT